MAEELDLMVCILTIIDQILNVYSSNILLSVCWQEEIPETSMFFVQLPPTIPSIKQSNIADSKEATESSQPPGSASNKQKSRALGELPEGFMGKMLVYRSGAIKLKLGDTLYDVSTLSCQYEVLSTDIHFS